MIKDQSRDQAQYSHFAYFWINDINFLKSSNHFKNTYTNIK